MQVLRKAVLLAISAAVFAQTSHGQNAIPHDVVGSGGGQSVGGSVFLHDTIGQPVIGVTTYNTNIHKIGFWYAVDQLHIGPTSAVAITSFRAQYVRGGVDLAWTIGHADGLRGYNVYRSHTRDGPFQRLNETLLPADEGTIFRDDPVRPGTVYRYQLGAVDADGEFLSPVISLETPKAVTALYQNFPNPFNPTTTISFYLPRLERVVLTIYDVEGRSVRRLVNENVTFGRTDVTWDGRNDNGERVGSGVYFSRLKAGNKVLTRKLTVLK